MKSGWGMLLAAALIGVTLSCAKSSNPNATGTGLIWVTTEGDQQVRAFNLNISSGSVGQVGGSQSTGVTPVAMALTPDGTALFIANNSDGTITSYPVSSDGSLGSSTMTQTSADCSLLPPPPCPGAPPPPACGQFPRALAIDPSGKFLFVADQGTFDQCDPSGNSARGLISTFSINGNTLTLSSVIQTQTVADITGTGPSAIVVAPTGNFLYVANEFSNTVQAYSYDSAGTVSLLNTYPAGSNPSALAFSRCAGVTTGTTICPAADGNNLFVANSGSNNISIFVACIQASTNCGAQGAAPDGSLTPVATPTVGAGNGPVALIVQPVENFVYAVNSKGNTVSQYRYSSVTGALTALTPASVNTGTNPFGGGATSDGSHVVVSNNNGSSMSVYTIDSTGRLAPGSTPTVTLAGQPAAILVR
jgi:6-phosphogluconolactonase (cycloisomerase 2 family)